MRRANAMAPKVNAIAKASNDNRLSVRRGIAFLLSKTAGSAGDFSQPANSMHLFLKVVGLRHDCYRPVW